MLPQSDIKAESPPSVGTRGDSRGATQVNAIETKIPVVRQQGGKSQRHSFQVRHTAEGMRLYPCSITGAPELGYLPVGVRPFNSEVHSASALLPDSHHHSLKTMPIRLSGNRFEAYSSSSAFLDTIGRDFMTDGGGCQEEIAHVSPK